MLSEGRKIYEDYHKQRHPHKDRSDSVFDGLSLQIKSEIKFIIAFLEIRKKYREAHAGEFYEPK